MYDEPERKLFELQVVYQDGTNEINLVLARNELDASAQLGKFWEPSKPVAGMKTQPCDRYSAVVIKRRIK